MAENLFARSEPPAQRDIFFDLFARHFDALCATAGNVLLAKGQANLDVVAAMLVCLRRLDKIEDARELGADAIRQSSRDPRTEWYRLLLHFLSGSKPTAAELLWAASRDPILAPRRRLEAHFYIGELQLCAGNVDDATTSFLSAVAAASDMHESRLASKELAYIRSPLPKDITTQLPGALFTAAVKHRRNSRPLDAVQCLLAASAQFETFLGKNDDNTLLSKLLLAQLREELCEHKAALAVLCTIVESFDEEKNCPVSILSHRLRVEALTLHSAGDSAAALSIAFRAARLEEQVVADDVCVASPLASHVKGKEARTAYAGTEQRAAIDALVSIVMGDFRDDTKVVSATLEAVIQRKLLRKALLNGEAHAVRTLRQATTATFLVQAAEGELSARRALLALRRELARQIKSGEQSSWHDIPDFLLSGTLATALAHDRSKKAGDDYAVIEEAINGCVRDALQSVLENRDQVKLNAILARLPDDHVWVEIFRYRRAFSEPAECYAVFIMMHGAPSTPMLVEMDDTEGIKSCLDQLLADLQVGLYRRPGPAETLRIRVFDPIRERVGSASRLLIAGDGIFHSFPFDILPLPKDGHVIDHYHISHLDCGADLLKTQAAVPTTPPVIIANPDFEYKEEDLVGNYRSHGGPVPVPGARLEPLPATELEGREVHAITGGILLTGTDATKTAAMKIKSPLLLHIATHGFAAPFSVVMEYANLIERQYPPGAKMVTSDTQEEKEGYALETILAECEPSLLRSCLAFTGANTWVHEGTVGRKAGTGVLTALEAMSIDVSGTELVVLSACETGRGDIVFDTVPGLRRSFLGAASLCVALWSVPDGETRMLMTTFYGFLKDGAGKSEALWRAKQRVRGTGKMPLYWGAFILVGDDGPVKFRP